MVIRNAALLIALDAVVLDTETTGLDPASARIVEIGAVRLVGGRVETADSFQRLVQPDVRIPQASSAIHQIDDAKVANASRFAEVWPELSEYIGDSIVVGHTIGFDLAVLKSECDRSGITFRQPRTLDTRLLAQVAEPNLAGFALEGLASWLGIELAQRHSALGDALTTARIFTALVPKLRDGGIRTLGEAAQACRAMTNVLDEQHRAGWVEAVDTPDRADAERTLGRIDSYPYRHRIRDVMRTPARFVAADTPLAEALAQMLAERISSLFIRPAQDDHNGSRASETGIITERDVLRSVSKNGRDALDIRVEKLMNKPLAVVPADAFVYRAIGRMNRLGVRHLGVVDEMGEVIGALSARDLLKLRASEAVSLGDEIDAALDVHSLGAAWAKLPQMVAALLAEGVNARDVAAVISDELGALTRQAAVIAETQMREAGYGGPSCAYAVAVLGSAGRSESLLAMDQDNALVFTDGAPGGQEDVWFEKLGSYLADILHQVGVPYCKGGVMAKNPQWRGSVATWRKRINDWIRASRPEDILSVDIFFDLRPVYGDGRLCTALWQGAFDAAHGEIAFTKLLAGATGSSESAFGIFRQIKTSEGRIDLKRFGLFGVVSTARVLAIHHHVVERSTPARLAGVKALGIGGKSDLDALLEAQETFLDLLAIQQIDDIKHGTPPSNAVAVKRLSSNDRVRLRTALEAVRHLDDLMRDLLFET
jgi:DNA polymerase-3 subunit epsilon/CBS domain-containing protein